MNEGKLGHLERASVLAASDDPKDQDKAREIKTRFDYESLKRQIGSKKKPSKPAVKEAAGAGVPLTPQELEIQKKMSRLNVRLAKKRSQQLQKAKLKDTEDSPEKVKDDQMQEGSLHKWFKGSKSKDGKAGWVNVKTGGTCASDEPGEGTPKCVSSSKRASMTKAERNSASRRKKAADPNQQSKSGAAKPTYVRTDAKKKMNEDKVLKKVAKELTKASKMHKGQAEKIKKHADEMKKVDEACWKGYKARGMKKKGGKLVPNCKPIGEAKEEVEDLKEYSPNVTYQAKGGRKSGKLGKSSVYSLKDKGESKKEFRKSQVKDIKGGYLKTEERELDERTLSSYIPSDRQGEASAANREYVKSQLKKKEDESTKNRGDLSKRDAGKMAKQRLHNKRIMSMGEAKVDKGRSDYGKASIRNYRRMGPGHGEPAMFDPENKRGKLIDKRREEHKSRRGVKGAKVPAYKTEEVVAEADKKGKGSGSKDACYHKVKASAKVWPSAYASGRLVQCRKKGAANYGKSKSEEFEYETWTTDVILEKVAAWQRKEGKRESGGLNQKGVDSYRRDNPGSKLKTAVTTKPSKLKKGSKSANRRKSFCARMSGMKKKLTSAKTANDPDSRINKSLRKWNCSYEPEGTPIMEKDTALDFVRKQIEKKHGKGAIYDGKSKSKSPSPAEKAKASAERKKRQDADNKAYASRAKKAGYKSTQDYTDVVARYGSEDNYRKGKGLGT
jgi:hypothetical protein